MGIIIIDEWFSNSSSARNTQLMELPSYCFATHRVCEYDIHVSSNFSSKCVLSYFLLRSSLMINSHDFTTYTFVRAVIQRMMFFHISNLWNKSPIQYLLKHWIPCWRLCPPYVLQQFDHVRFDLTWCDFNFTEQCPYNNSSAHCISDTYTFH